jgi:hypothetical protein
MFEKLLDVIAQFRATSKRGENGQASEESVK